MQDNESAGSSGENHQHDRDLWKLGQSSGISRRKFLGLMATDGAAAVFAACGGDVAPTPESGQTTATMVQRVPLLRPTRR